MRFPFPETIPIAHRGAHGPGRPENSLAAIARAAELGAPGIELDACRLADGSFVAHHDAEIPVGDRQVAVGTLTPAEAHELGLASLESCLDLLAAADALVLLDWKAGAGEADAVVALRARGLLARTIFCSSDATALVRARAAEPVLVTGLSLDRPLRPSTLERLLSRSGARAAMLSRSCVRAELAGALRRAGQGLFVWTFAGRDDLEPFLRLAPDGVITDAIEEELKVERRRAPVPDLRQNRARP